MLAGEGRRYGLLGDDELQVFLAAAILTLVLTPVLVAAGPRVAAVARRLGLPAGTESVGERPVVEPLADHVVIVGFGVGGRNLARVLREASIRYVVVELAGEVARAARAEREPVLFGDATRVEILRLAGIERARVAVFAISDRDALHRAVSAARALAPRLVLVARTRHVADLEELAGLGADEVVAEEFESSIELFARVLAHYHVPRHVIDAQERALRGDRYRGLRSALAGEQVSAAVLEALAAGTVDVFRVIGGARAAGRSIRELEVRRTTGATILALVRDGLPLSNPSPDQRLEAGDSSVLVGSHAEIEHAFRLLDRPTATPAAEGTRPSEEGEQCQPSWSPGLEGGSVVRCSRSTSGAGGRCCRWSATRTRLKRSPPSPARARSSPMWARRGWSRRLTTRSRRRIWRSTCWSTTPARSRSSVASRRPRPRIWKSSSAFTASGRCAARGRRCPGCAGPTGRRW